MNTDTTTPSAKPTVKRSLGNAILVNPTQEKNPVLHCVRNVPYEFDGSLKADYVVGATTGVLYLSLRYHRLYPNYIYGRMAALKSMYVLRVLMVLVDTDDHYAALRELNLAAISHQFTLMLSWSHDETARYLETYKAFEHKPDDLIREKPTDDTDYYATMSDTLTNINSVNKTDALTLMSTFGSFAAMAQADADQLGLCPGFGERKVQRFQKAFTQPFLIHQDTKRASDAPAPS
ncbi:restriction endonuclease type II-like protein [Gongronella butleri]|nr:restriction endonuclease type II-like protein [Gongronella butleri]